MARDEDILAIVERGRRTRNATPRWLWIWATIVGAVCATGFAIALLAERESTSQSSQSIDVRSEIAGGDAGGDARGAGGLLRGSAARSRIAEHRDSGSGGGAGGLVIGVALGIVIGIAIGRQRSHSSRNSP